MTESFVERIAVLEEKVRSQQTTLQEINQKLDELLTLRHKGVGAFWLASSLLGTGIVGFIVTVFEYIRSH